MPITRETVENNEALRKSLYQLGERVIVWCIVQVFIIWAVTDKVYDAWNHHLISDTIAIRIVCGLCLIFLTSSFIAFQAMSRKVDALELITERSVNLGKRPDKQAKTSLYILLTATSLVSEAICNLSQKFAYALANHTPFSVTDISRGFVIYVFVNVITGIIASRLIDSANRQFHLRGGKGADFFKNLTKFFNSLNFVRALLLLSAGIVNLLSFRIADAVLEFNPLDFTYGLISGNRIDAVFTLVKLEGNLWFGIFWVLAIFYSLFTNVFEREYFRNLVTAIFFGKNAVLKSFFIRMWIFYMAVNGLTGVNLMERFWIGSLHEGEPIQTIWYARDNRLRECHSQEGKAKTICYEQVLEAWQGDHVRLINFILSSSEYASQAARNQLALHEKNGDVYKNNYLRLLYEELKGSSIGEEVFRREEIRIEKARVKALYFNNKSLTRLRSNS